MLYKRQERGEVVPLGSSEETMRLQDMMTESVRTIPPAATAEEARNLMRTQRIHHLVVMNGARIVGVLSDRDIGGRLGASVTQDRTVADLMTDRVVTVAPETTVRRAANLMRGRSIGCLIVASAGRPVGIVTVADLLELLGKGADRGAAMGTRPTLHHRVPHRKVRGSTGVW
jgi:acetoin utilization protein AcuB